MSSILSVGEVESRDSGMMTGGPDVPVLVMGGFSCLVAALWLCPVQGTSAQSPGECIAQHQSAQELRLGQQYVAAAAALAQCASPACPGPVRSDCQLWHQELEQVMPSLHVRVTGPDRAPLLGARVQVDGRAYATDAGAVRLRLDSGPHRVLVGAPGYVSQVRTVDLADGQALEAAFDLTVTAADPSAGASGVDAGSAGDGIPTASFVLGGVAVAGLAGFAGFGLLGEAEYDALKRGCSPNCTRDQTSLGRRYYVLADVSLGVSIAAAVAAIAVALTDGDDGPDADTLSAPPVRAGLDPVRGRVSVSGVF